MGFQNTLGKVATRPVRAGFSRASYLGELAAVATRRAAVAQRARLGDLGKAAAPARNRTSPFRLRGLGDTSCVIDPTTGGRVCNSPALPTPTPPPTAVTPPPVTYPPANAAGGSYGLTCQNIVDNGSSLSARCKRIDGSWMPTTVYYASCSGDITNIDGTLTCNVPGQVTYAPGTPPTSSTTPAPPVPVVPNPAQGPVLSPTGVPIPVVIDPSTGIPFTQEYPASQLNPSTGYPYSYGYGTTIQPATPYGATPTTFVNTQPAAIQASSPTPWNKILLYGGLGVGGLIVLKMLGVIGKK